VKDAISEVASLPTLTLSEHLPAAGTKSKVMRSKRDRRRATPVSVPSASPQCSVSTSATSSTAINVSNPIRDLVARIYEEELRKLMSAAELKGNAGDAGMYDREIKRVSFLRAGNPPSQSSNSIKAEDKESINGLTSANLEEIATVEDDMPQDLSVGRHKVSTDTVTFESVLHTSDTGSDDADSLSLAVDGLSPLQRMQCIANSLPATTVTQSVGGAASSRQLLPPISSEQLAACEEMNTDDVVAKVREMSVIN